MGRHSIPDPGDPRAGPAQPGDGDQSSDGGRSGEDGRRGRRRRIGGPRRGVSVGVITALVTVVALVGVVILWQFLGDVLSRRSSDAARSCLDGTANVAVVADPSIAEIISSFSEDFNRQATPVGDTCVNVTVTQADSEAVISGLTADWPAELGERPALWIPASSVQSARLQSSAGKQAISDDRSLVSTPVVLAVRPQLKNALAQDTWAALPALQTDQTALDARELPGWGSLRLALPTGGDADAAYLAAEAVASASVPPDAPPTDGLGAVRTLLAGQPRLADTTMTEAWNVLTGSRDDATAPVHAVVMTEQQLFTRSAELPEEAGAVVSWIPSGPVALADYPTALLSGPWLVDEQVAAASEFARFIRKPDQINELVDLGFRAEGATAKGNDVVGFPDLDAPLPVGDDTLRSAIAGAIAPASGAATTVMLNQNLAGVADALSNRIAALPPNAVVGLWTFNGVEGSAPVPTGPLGDQLADQTRSAALTGVLDGLTPVDGGAVSFTTLRLAYSEAVADYLPGQPNSVLVITSGPHTDRTLDGPGLQDFVTTAFDPGRPVAINVIDIGADPDRPTWEAVAQATGGSYQAVPDPDSPDLTAAITRLLG